MPPLPAIPGLPIPTGAPGYTPPSSAAPAATPSQQTPSVPGVPNGLDPKAFILTKAIAYQENGGKTPSYTIKGGSGEYGAYQYTPATWAARAAKYLGPNAPALTDATPEQQNQVQYDWVKDKLDQGYTPAQIASMHNAGEGAPNAYLGNSGTNKYGVKYDTKQYTMGVQKYAEQLYAGLDPAAAAQAPVPGNGPGTPDATPQNPLQALESAAGGAWHSLTDSKPTDDGLTAGLKATANLIPSAFGFVKGAISSLNPLTTIGNIARIPQAFSDAVAANGGDVGKTLGYAFGAVPGAVGDVASQIAPGAADVVKAGIGFAQHPDQILPTLENLAPGPGVPTQYTPGIDDNLQKASAEFTNNPFSNAAPLVFGADAALGGIDAATGGIAALRNSSAEAATAARTADYLNNIDAASTFKAPIPELPEPVKGTNLQGAFRSGVEKVAAPIANPRSVFGRTAPADATAPGAAPALPEKMTNTAGQVVQGTKADQATAARVLTKVDTTGVKTYQDLSDRLGTAIKDNQAKVDAEYAKNPTPKKLSDLTQTETHTIDGKTVTEKSNYVKVAIDHLQELYSKTHDTSNLAKIKAIAAKAKSTGLTPAEINGLAKTYGTEFGTKAFNKRTGEALTSVNAQAYENVRSGVKDTARSLLSDKAAQALDKQTSEMIKVKGLVDTMAKKVNSLEQRVVKRNIVEKVARGLGSVIDFATFGGPKAFVQKLFFPSNVGLKTMNSIDLENQLRSNLKTIRSIEHADDTTFANGIIKAARAVNALPTTPLALPSTVFGRREPSAVAQ